jgi:hypothetical protein
MGVNVVVVGGRLLKRTRTAYCAMRNSGHIRITKMVVESHRCRI